MSHPRRWSPVASLVLAVFLVAPALGAAGSPARPHARDLPAASASARGASLAAWQSAMQAAARALGWLVPDGQAARGARRGFRLIPSCDEGSGLDPSGRCPGAATLTCDSGSGLDPSGNCHGG
jgi:hypothetical protein